MANAEQGTGLRIGILTDSATQLYALREIIASSGNQPSKSFISAETNGAALSAAQDDVDAWLIEADFSLPPGQWLELWLAHNRLPVVIGEGPDSAPGSDEHQAWLRRLTTKLRQLNGMVKLEQHPQGAAKEVWVLGASTGGPEAVVQFFQALPANLGVAFVYAQHIDKGFEKNLVEMLNRKSRYRAFLVEHGDVLHINGIAVLPTDRCIEVLENGTLMMKDQDWPGPYSPSIDQVVANVARNFPSRCGAVIFSGMGNDGAASSKLIRQRGGLLWVQSPETCACPSMPDAVLGLSRNGIASVDAIGTPTALAAAFSQRLQATQINKRLTPQN